jgi:hypothetical protein
VACQGEAPKDQNPCGGARGKFNERLRRQLAARRDAKYQGRAREDQPGAYKRYLFLIIEVSLEQGLIRIVGRRCRRGALTHVCLKPFPTKECCCALSQTQAFGAMMVMTARPSMELPTASGAGSISIGGAGKGGPSPACEAIRVLEAMHGNGRELEALAEDCKAAVALWHAFSSDEAVVGAVLLALTRLANKYDPQQEAIKAPLRLLLGQLGVCEMLASVTRQWPARRTWAFGLIYIITLRTAPNVEPLARAGICQTVLDAMRDCPEDQALLTYALSAVANLAWSSELSINRLHEAGALPAVAWAMRAFPSAPELQQSALNCVFNLCERRHDVALAEGICPLVLDALRHCPDGITQRLGIQAIFGLAADDQCRSRLLDHGAAEVVARALQNYGNSAGVVEVVGLAVARLGQGGNENARRVADTGICRVVCDLLARDDAEGDYASDAALLELLSALTRLGPQLVRALMEADAPDAVFAVLQRPCGVAVGVLAPFLRAVGKLCEEAEGDSAVRERLGEAGLIGGVVACLKFVVVNDAVRWAWELALVVLELLCRGLPPNRARAQEGEALEALQAAARAGDDDIKRLAKRVALACGYVFVGDEICRAKPHAEPKGGAAKLGGVTVTTLSGVDEDRGGQVGGALLPIPEGLEEDGSYTA